MPPILAVHLSDGVVGAPVAAMGFLVAALLVAWSLPAVTDEATPRVALFTAAFFVVTQLHLPVGVGSAHLLLNGLLGVVLRRAAVTAIAVGLFLQALLLGHGGLTALGVNVAVYAVPTLIAAALAGPFGRLAGTRRVLAGILLGGGAAALTVALNAAVIRLAGPTTSRSLALTVAAVHLPIVATEAVMTGFVLDYLVRVKPEWFAAHASGGNTSSNGTSH